MLTPFSLPPSPVLVIVALLDLALTIPLIYLVALKTRALKFVNFNKWNQVKYSYTFNSLGNIMLVCVSFKSHFF
jgi:hypothetical protein